MYIIGSLTTKMYRQGSKNTRSGMYKQALALALGKYEALGSVARAHYERRQLMGRPLPTAE